LTKPPESHYNINTLNIIFAVFAVILLASLGGVIMKDYQREWKDYQKAFRALEIEKTRAKYALAAEELENNPEFKAVLSGIEEEDRKYRETCLALTETRDTIRALETETVLREQEFRGVNTELTVAKFNYEEARAHHSPGLEAARQKYEDRQTEAAALRLELEEIGGRLEAATAVLNNCGQRREELNRKKRLLALETDLTKRKLANLDPDEMSLINRVANVVRDLPILDLSTPNQKIEQIVLKDISDDLIIKQMPKVERCVTCHLGIINPAYADAPQPFTTHPNLEKYVGNDSPHPIEEFGCTVCHGGRGRGTGFISAAHTPRSPEQRGQWEKDYKWEALHHWEDPMLPGPYFEAGCFKCHSAEADIGGAEKLNLGLQLIEKAGCYNCHLIERYKDWPKSGPGLISLADKVSREWAYRWIADPAAFRHNTWMPNYFDLSNNNDPESRARSEQEVHAITQYLFTKSQNKPRAAAATLFKGDPKHGEELVASLGCYACHKIQPGASDAPATREDLHREHGPNLIGLGDKTSRDWLVAWLKDPAQYHPGTRMPGLRLSEQEAADITEYLVSGHDPEFSGQPIPAVNETVIDDITLDFLKSSDPERLARKKLSEMSLDDKLFFSGEQLIGHYGCYSCHDIAGFEGRKPIGIELTHQGDKPVDKLDFGFIHIGHNKWSWLTQKLRDPRGFDLSRVRAFREKLRMPDFKLKPDEIEAIVTAILGFVDDKTVKNQKPPVTAGSEFIRQGEMLVKQLNCTACHVIEGEGGAIRETVKAWLKDYRNMPDSEVEKVYASFTPPNLHGAGKKLNPEWLFNFLHQPETVRPWLNVRMPSYRLNTSHLNMLVKYFNFLDKEEFPFFSRVDTTLDEDQFQAGEKLFSQEYLGCNLCHVVGDRQPSGSVESWAPNLALAKTRLKPEWIIKWLKNPAALMPGTKMPTFWDPEYFEDSGPPDIAEGDENEQIRLLRNYLMSLADQPDGPETVAPPATLSPVIPDPATLPVSAAEPAEDDIIW
jgi:cytochrome c2